MEASMPGYKNITIRVDVDSTLFAEIQRRRVTCKSWSGATQDLLNEGWHTLLLQQVAEKAVKDSKKPVKQNQSPQINREYVRRLEALLALFICDEKHPRYQENNID
jgi:hypothetical protein